MRRPLSNRRRVRVRRRFPIPLKRSTVCLPCADSTDTPTTPVATQANADGELPSVSRVSAKSCDDESILRNEANDEPDDLSGSGRLPDAEAPCSEAAPLDARRTSQLEPSNSVLVTGQIVDLQPPPQHETTAAPEEPPAQEIEGPAGLVATVDSGGNSPLNAATFEGRSTENRDRDTVSDPPPDQPPALGIERAPPSVEAPAAGPATVRAPRRCLTPEQLVHNERVGRYRAMKGLSPL